MSINTNSTSFVTVTFTGDKWLMLLQAHSIEKFITKPITHYVIIDDVHEPVTSSAEWLILLQNIYKKHKLVLITRESAPSIFFDTQGYTREGVRVSGWTTQQYSKLAISKIIDSEYYIVLDSKNIFIKETDPKELEIEGCDQLMDHTHPGYDYFLPFVAEVCGTFNKPMPKTFWFAGTPFGLKTSLVQQIMKHDINSFFLKQYIGERPISEFLLYRCFVERPTLEDDRISFTRTPPSASTENMSSSKIDEVWENYANELPVSMTVFRHLQDDMDWCQRTAKILINQGLDSAYVLPGLLLTRKHMGHG